MADRTGIGDPELPASSSMSMAPHNEAASAATPGSPISSPATSPNLVVNGHANGLALTPTGEAHAALLAAPTASGYGALNSPELYLNRELTWLAFNQRVLAEAEDDTNPLLERVKFLAIGCATIDEFFMKRIGGLKHQVVAAVHELTPDGRTPQQQIVECYERLREIEARQRKLLPKLVEELAQRGIIIDSYQGLKPEQQKELRDLYI